MYLSNGALVSARPERESEGRIIMRSASAAVSAKQSFLRKPKKYSWVVLSVGSRRAIGLGLCVRFGCDSAQTTRLQHANFYEANKYGRNLPQAAARTRSGNQTDQGPLPSTPNTPASSFDHQPANAILLTKQAPGAGSPTHPQTATRGLRRSRGFGADESLALMAVRSRRKPQKSLSPLPFSA